MANPGNPVLPTYNIQAPAGHAYPPALRQLRLRAGPQLNTGEPPWTRHRNTTSGENWDHAPWETRPPNYSIPLNPNLPALHSRSDQRDVNRLLTSTNLTTNTLGGASAQTGLTPHDLCGGPSPQPQHCLPAGQSTARQPHNGETTSRRDEQLGSCPLKISGGGEIVKIEGKSFKVVLTLGKRERRPNSWQVYISNLA